MSAGGLTMDLVCVLESGDYEAGDDSRFIEYVAAGLVNMGWIHRSEVAALDTQAWLCYDGDMIQLHTNGTNRPIGVNPAKVVWVCEATNGGGTYVKMEGGHGHHVREPYEEVMGLLNGLKKK